MMIWLLTWLLVPQIDPEDWRLALPLAMILVSAFIVKNGFWLHRFDKLVFQNIPHYDDELVPLNSNF